MPNLGFPTSTTMPSISLRADQFYRTYGYSKVISLSLTLLSFYIFHLLVDEEDLNINNKIIFISVIMSIIIDWIIFDLVFNSFLRKELKTKSKIEKEQEDLDNHGYINSEAKID